MAEAERVVPPETWPGDGSPRPERPTSDWQTYRRLFGYVTDQLGWFLLALLGFLLTAAGEVGFVRVFGIIIDEVEYPMPAYIWQFPLLMLGLALTRAFGTVTGEYTLARVSFRAVHVIRAQLFERLLLLPSKFYDESARGQLVSRLTFTTAQLRDTTTDALKIVISDGLKGDRLLGRNVHLQLDADADLPRGFALRRTDRPLRFASLPALEHAHSEFHGRCDPRRRRGGRGLP